MRAPHRDALAPLPAGFFLKPIPCRSNKRQTALRLPLIRRPRIAATTSSSVKSGCSAIKPNRKFACFSNGDVLPPVGLAAMLPVLSQRCSHLTAELALISKRSAASRRDAPVITASSTRSRRSTEQGFGIDASIESMPLHSLNSAKLRIPIQPSRDMLFGHNTLRLMVMGLEDRAPTEIELNQMIALLEDGLRVGALGMSSGLFTPPGSFARSDEIKTLCAVLKKYNAAYFTHIRDESNKVMDAIEEAIDIARATGVHVEIVHLKCSGVDNWGKATQILDRIAAARAEGCEIDCDAYPYTAGANPLKNLLPGWAQVGGNEAMLARLAQPEVRARIRTEIAEHGLNNWGRIPSWDAVQISISPRMPKTAGQTVASLATMRGCDPIDQICDHLIEDNGATRVLVTSISEDDVRAIVHSPTALVGSDGNCVATYGTVSQGMPHPRFYGTFPRVISRYVYDERLIPLEQAIYKMTGGSAKALKLRDRGLLRTGYQADITIFDPDDFRDEATYADPHRYPSGARTTVIVNGTVVVDNASHTGATPGFVLRRGSDGQVS